ncbi:hypothetical protein M1247_11575 [Mycobacterium sp. 21AC1]|uniref:hypothetical protein n=1 Tax=[Mycobacterium] appelbergii TaxID=2939269 RepID=UPI00293925F9|nr:hypothetical protein [Mycobacterium sp. 21AC1]MDV3125555.1 hypothetical protein [Mycobacterium sp. 21AC1]
MTQEPQGRPEDVDTGFWLWVVALPLMVIGYLLDAVTTAAGAQRLLVIVFSVIFMVVLCSIVVAFLILLRQGYRWCRTLLTTGGLVSVVHAVSSLLTGERQAGAAVGYAITAIVGSVLIMGGIYLLHRKDANGFFVA